MSQILIVDDERMNRDLLKGMLTYLGHESQGAEDGHQALVMLAENEFDLVLMDVMLPGLNGFEVVSQMRKEPKLADLPVMMVTALTSKEDRLQAVACGANDFISKPVEISELRIRSTSLLRLKEAQDAIKRHQAALEEMVRVRTRDLRRALETVRHMQRETTAAHLDTVHRLAITAAYKCARTLAHVHRISQYAAVLARGLGLPEEEIEIVKCACPLFDVGKIAIPDEILWKRAQLTEYEWGILKRHTVLGERILSGSSSNLLRAAAVIAASHHERWDGTGYPNGLAGDEVPLHGRICAVVDVFDQVSSQPPFGEGLATDMAVGVITGGKGVAFDPTVVDIFVDRRDELLAIRERYPDQETVGTLANPDEGILNIRSQRQAQPDHELLYAA